ncbi:MAG: VOC family protein [Pseudomonadota bacterium]|nr:VOC family protein [Pseudomonadota bacterium]
MEIHRIDHFVLTARDVDTICEFYERVLGMTVKTFGEGRKALYFGSQKINVHPPVGTGPSHRAGKPAIGGSDFCLITKDSMADVAKHLKSEGVCIELGPDKRSGAIGSITSIYFRDPDGNLVEISNYD